MGTRRGQLRGAKGGGMVWSLCGGMKMWPKYSTLNLIRLPFAFLFSSFQLYPLRRRHTKSGRFHSKLASLYSSCIGEPLEGVLQLPFPTFRASAL